MGPRSGPGKPKELAADCLDACFRQCCVETLASEADEGAVKTVEWGDGLFVALAFPSLRSKASTQCQTYRSLIWLEGGQDLGLF